MDAFISDHRWGYRWGHRSGQQRVRQHHRIRALVAAIVLLSTAAAIGQTSGSAAPISADALVRAVVANELKPSSDDHSRWMYEVIKEQDGQQLTTEVIQTRDGSVEQLVAVDGRPLSGQKREEESARLRNLLTHPQEQQKIEQTRKKDAAQCESFFRMIPDAFLFAYAGQDGSLVRVSFKPNPKFDPPTREARVFHAMEGEMVIESHGQRLAAITGRLMEDVKFGGGLLAHLEKGGEFHVERKDVGHGHWEMTAIAVHMNGKALFLKTIAVQQRESRQGFRKVADDLTLMQAAQLLDKPSVMSASQGFPDRGKVALPVSSLR